MFLREADCSLRIHEFTRVAISYSLGPILRLIVLSHDLMLFVTCLVTMSVP